MRQRLLLAGLLLLAAVAVPVSAPSAEEIKTGPLVAGKNVPGTFHPYNVTARVLTPEELAAVEEEDKDKGKAKDKDKKKPTYSSKDKFHCLITEYDLDPVVMLFARGLDDNEVFGKLLEKIDAACQKNRGSRMRAFVVFLFDDLTNVVTQDEKRKAAVEKVNKVQAKHKLSNVVLTIAAKSDLEKYELADDVALTVVMYRNLRIQASRTVPRDDLDKDDSPAIKAVLADVSDKLLPRR